MTALLLIFASPLRAEEAKAEKPIKPMSPKEVSNGMADVWCQKMTECAKDNSMGPRECKKILYKSFMSGFDNVAKDQKVDVMPQNFEECMKNVKAGTCEALKTAQTLAGCEFISAISKPI